MKCKISGESVFLDQEPPAVVLKIMLVVGKLRRRNKFSHSLFIDHSFQNCQEFLPEKVLTAANVTLSLTKFVIPVGIHFGTIERGSGGRWALGSVNVLLAVILSRLSLSGLRVTASQCPGSGTLINHK